jgi:cation diffusion facilitator family transporter
MSLQRVRRELPDPHRQRLYRRAILVAIVGNALLAAAKGAVTWLSGSSAVFSDAANSLSDTLYSLLMAVGLYLAQRPADESHPQGHSRFEPLVSLFITVMMGMAGLAALRGGVQRFLSGAVVIEPGWPTAALAGSVLVKIAMCLLVGRIGRRADSPAIRASARDNLADVLTSAAALLGVWGSRLVHPLLDPVAGVVVSLWIFCSTWEILRENLGYLTGRGAQPEFTAQIAAAASTVPGVRGVHQVIADHVGPQLRVDMHIDVDSGMTLHQAHAIADQVQARVEALPAVDLAFVHTEPAGFLSGEGDQRRIDVQLRQLAEELGVRIHNVWVYEVDGSYYVDVHAEFDGDLPLREAHALISALEDRARGEIPHLVEVTAHIEPQGQLIKTQDAGLGEDHMVQAVQRVISEALDLGACHQVQVRRSDMGWSVSMHCTLPGERSLAEAHQVSTQLETRLREGIPGLERVMIHTEPEEG